MITWNLTSFHQPAVHNQQPALFLSSDMRSWAVGNYRNFLQQKIPAQGPNISVYNILVTSCKTEEWLGREKVKCHFWEFQGFRAEYLFTAIREFLFCRYFTFTNIMTMPKVCHAEISFFQEVLKSIYIDKNHCAHRSPFWYYWTPRFENWIRFHPQVRKTRLFYLVSEKELISISGI
jgi:hypothetical protein